MIFHNIIVEDKRDNYEHTLNYNIVEGITPKSIVNYGHHPCDETYFQISKELHDLDTHTALQADLIEET